MKRNVINVDVDGVLTNGEIWWEETPTVNREMRKFVQDAYYSCKYVIIIWSARLWRDTAKTVGWLIANEIPFHGVMMQKGPADVYIDDKCILPTKDELKRLLDEDIDVPMCGKLNREIEIEGHKIEMEAFDIISEKLKGNIK